MRKKIVIDVMGCDKPEAVIDGLALALKELPEVQLIAVGDQELILSRLGGVEFDQDRLEIIYADEVITNDDSPVEAVRKKKQSSLVVALNLLKQREDVGAMICAGSTGAVIAGSVLILGRDRLSDRPTLVTLLPNDEGGITCLADCGANVDCRPAHLVQFARCTADYMSKVYGLKSPRIGLLSVGTEKGKGNLQVKEAYGLLEQSELNFVGNMEAREALSGDYDVIVCDGFSGNVLLKSIEGTAKTVAKQFASLIVKNIGEGADLSFLKKATAELYSKLDFNSMGGAVLLGVKKPIVKAHGSANATTVVNTVKQAYSICLAGLE